MSEFYPKYSPDYRSDPYFPFNDKEGINIIMNIIDDRCISQFKEKYFQYFHIDIYTIWEDSSCKDDKIRKIIAEFIICVYNLPFQDLYNTTLEFFDESNKIYKLLCEDVIICRKILQISSNITTLEKEKVTYFLSFHRNMISFLEREEHKISRLKEMFLNIRMK